MLRNDYYAGVVLPRPLVSAATRIRGRHEQLVPLPLFQRVQDQLTAKRLAGERERVHHTTSRARSTAVNVAAADVLAQQGTAWATFDYFVRRGRQLKTCSQRFRPVDLIEDAITPLLRHRAAHRRPARARADLDPSTVVSTA